MSQPDTSSPEPCPAPRAWHAPRLVRVGSVRDIAQQGINVVQGNGQRGVSIS